MTKTREPERQLCRLDTLEDRAHRKADNKLARIAQQRAKLAAAVELARIDSEHRNVWPKAVSGDYEATDKVLDLMEHRAELLGLDRPPGAAWRTQQPET